MRCDSAEGKREGRAEMCLSAEGGSVEVDKNAQITACVKFGTVRVGSAC